MIRPADPAELSTARLGVSLSLSRDGAGFVCAPALYGLLAALVSAAITALLLAGAR